MHRFFSLLLLLVLSGSAVQSQEFSGQWEGQVRYIRGSTGIVLNTRLELLQSANFVYGILYSRGAEKGTVFGCDYFVQGTLVNNKVKLTVASVQRHVSMEKDDCYALDYVQLQVKDSITANGEWAWVEEPSKLFALHKTSASISFSAEEEITGYFQDRMRVFDSLGVILAPVERLRFMDRKLTVPESTVILELRSVDTLQGDTLSMYMNDEQVVSPRNIGRNPLRVRLVLPDSGDVELLFVHENKVRPVARIRVGVRVNSKVDYYELELTGTKNLLWLLEYKKEGP